MSSSATVNSNKKVKRTRTNEQCESSVSTPKRYYLKTAGHSTYALTKMYEMKQRGQLCDVTLKVGSESFKAHRVVLASVSPYFFSMFNGAMLEQVTPEIVLRDMDAGGMKLLLEYAYTGQITITENNVEVLLPVSTLLQMQEVREACCQFLVKQLHLTNCWRIKSLADTLSCKQLLEKAHCFIMENFQEVANTKEFLLLPFNGVEELVSNRQLNTSSEEVVYNAVLNWINHDLTNRSHYMGKLMVHVRLQLVDSNFLLTVIDKEPLMHEDSQCKDLLNETMRHHLASLNARWLATTKKVEHTPKETQPYLFAIGGYLENEPLFREDPQCREFLSEALKYHLAGEKRWVLATPRTVERKPKGAEPYLFAIGGAGSPCGTLSDCEVYNPRSNSWSTIAPMLSKRRRLGVTGLHRLLYAVGGFNGTSTLATAECYNPLLNTWTPIAPMGTPRSNLGICSFDDLIYACGGYDRNSDLNSMDRFDPITGVWYSCPAMNTIRGYCRIAVVESCIYAVGGPDEVNDLVERFDPRAGNWSPVPSMSSMRGCCSVAAIDGHLYCVGGYDGATRLSSGERFDVRKNAWEPISSMNNPRYAHQSAVIDGYIYAIGSCKHPSYLNSVEIYDPKTNKWSVITPMISKRYCFGAAVLDCIDIEHVLKRTNN